MEHFFSPCPRGLEALLRQELDVCGARDIAETPGGAAFSGDWECALRVNLESRIATRVLWRLALGPYRNEDDIYRLAYEVAWPALFAVERSLRVDVTAIRSPLRSLDFITLKVKDAICDRFRAERGRRPDVNTRNPDVRVQIFLTAQEATLYLDTSGEPLYRRGFKRAAVEAPLKENLAAGILMLTGWQHHEPLLDPTCGSGSFLLEAAQMALDIAPGLGRGFGFERLAGFDSGLWARLKGQAQERRRVAAPLALYGSDLYGEQVKRARENLAAAGLEGFVHLKQANLLELSPPAAAGVLVANPPYGERLGEKQELAQFYPRLGDALKQRYAGWRCHIFSADKDLPKRIGLRSSARIALFNGPLECRLYEYRMVAGSTKT